MEYDITEKIRELKRLQKEIDEAEETKKSILIDGIYGANNSEGYNDFRYKKALKISESNQSKIKQIIEEL